MKIAFFSTQKYDRDFFLKENDRFNFDLVFFEVHLKQETLELAKGYEAICVFVNDKIDQPMLNRCKPATVLLSSRQPFRLMGLGWLRLVLLCLRTPSRIDP